MAQRQSYESRIQHTPRVCGGKACIRSTRITVWGLVRYRQLGLANTEILDAYRPQLVQEDLDAAWTYYDAHRDEIEQNIAEEEQD